MDSEKILESCARVKKLQYLRPCAKQRRSFTPFMYSVDGMAGREVQAVKKRIAHLLAEKWERHYSELRGFARGGWPSPCSAVTLSSCAAHGWGRRHGSWSRTAPTFPGWGASETKVPSRLRPLDCRLTEAPSSLVGRCWLDDSSARPCS